MRLSLLVASVALVVLAGISRADTLPSVLSRGQYTYTQSYTLYNAMPVGNFIVAWYSSSTNYPIVGLDPVTMQANWTFLPNSSLNFVLPVNNNANLLLQTYSGRFIFLNALTGAMVWATSNSQDSFSHPVLPYPPMNPTSFYTWISGTVYNVNLVNGSYTKIYTIDNGYVQLPLQAWNSYIMIASSYEAIAITPNGTQIYNPTFPNTNTPYFGAIIGDGAYFLDDYQHLIAFNMTTGTFMYRTTSAVTSSNPMFFSATGSGALALATSNTVYRIAVNGTVMQSYTVPTDGYQFQQFFPTNGDLYVRDYYGSVYSLNGLTGALNWVASKGTWQTSNVKILNVINNVVWLSLYSATLPGYTGASNSFYVGLDVATGAIVMEMGTKSSGAISLQPMTIAGTAAFVIAENSYNSYVYTAFPATAPSYGFNAKTTILTGITQAGGLYMFADANYVYAINGSTLTSVWNYSFPNSPSSSPTISITTIPATKPTNTRVYVLYQSNYYSIATVYTLLLSTGLPIPTSPVDVISGSPSTCSNTPYPTVLTTDGSDLYFTAGTYCVYRIDGTANTLSAAVNPNSNRIEASTAPVFSSSFLYVTDYWGYGLRVPTGSATLFSSKTALASTSVRVTSSYPNSQAYADGNVFSGGDDGSLYCWGSTSLKALFQAPISSSDNVYPFGFYGFMYAFAGGRIAKLDTTKPVLSAYNMYWNTALFTQGSAMVPPSISADGTFASANGNYIGAMNGLTGQVFWNISAPSDASSCSSTQVPAVNTGLLFANCGSSIYTFDLYRGTVIARGEYFPSLSQFFMNGNTTVYMAGTSIRSAVAVNSPYSAGQLPKSLNAPTETLLQALEKNKAWIAGVVAGVVVLVIIVLVAKKLTGGSGKKDSDYVTMQNLNNGGV